jgi:O-antigen/teichoic acid export membrane protein
MAPDAVELNDGSGTLAASGSTEVTRSQIRGSSLLLIGNIISLSITFLPHVLLARYLTTEAYGHLTYALSLVAACKTYSLGFNEAMSRFVPIYRAKDEPSKALGSIVVVFAVTLAISGFFIAVFGLASRPILGLLTQGREPVGLVWILIFLVPLETLEILIMNLFACFARAGMIFWGRYIISPGMQVIVISLVVLKHYGLSFLASGYVLCQAVIVLPFAVLLIRELRRQKLLQAWASLTLPVREIFGFSGPLMASNVVGLMGNAIPVLLLGYFHPMSTVAFFRVVLPAATLSTMIQANFMPLFMPSASRLFAEHDTQGMNHLFWHTALWMGLLALPIFLVTFCFARPFTIFLYGARYAPSAPILAILSIGYYVQAVFGLNGIMLKAMGKVRLMVILNIITPIITVVLNLLLIPRFGAIGAAVATSVGLLVQGLLRQLGLSLGGGLSFFEARYASFFLVLGSSAFALYFIQRIVPSNIYVDLIMAAAVSVLVLRLVRRQLKIADTFPEILRLPLVGRLLA